MAEEIKEEIDELENTQDIYSDEEVTPETNKEENSSAIKEEASESTIQDTVQKKTPLLNKILFGVVGLLVLVLIAGLIMFFLGVFDPEKPVMEKEATKKEARIEDKNKFSIKDINSKKLNKQLLLLTNKNREIQEENDAREKEEEEKKILALEKKKQDEALALEEKKLADEKEFIKKFSYL